MQPDRVPFIWTRLHLPAPIDVPAAHAAVTALAGLAGHPLIVLETIGHEGAISWRMGCRADAKSAAISALTAHLPGLRTGAIASTFDGLRADQVAGVSFPGNGLAALRTDATEPVTRGLLAGLSRAGKNESVHVQVVLGPRVRPRRAQSRPAADRRLVTKFQDHHFSAAVRLAASAKDAVRTRSLIQSAAAALRGLEAPGVRLRLSRQRLTAFSQARTPWLWPNRLSVAEVVAVLAWPIGTMPLPGVPAQHPKLLTPLPTVPLKGRVLGRATAAHSDRPVALRQEDSLRHLHLIGPTGVGKSTLLARLAIDTMLAGQGGVVIDPKGDLIEDLLQRIPADRLDDVVVLDPRDPSPVGIAALAGDPEMAADTLLATFHSLYADAWGPRTQDILHACLLTLARRGDASLLLIPTLLTNPGFRRSVIGRVVKADPLGLGTFWGWFEGISEPERQAAIAPLMNKLRPILLRPALRGVLGQRDPRFSFSDIFDKKRILLVSLAKGTIGPEAAQLLGSLVVSLTWSAAQARASKQASQRSPVMIYVDELQDYLRLPGDLGDALAQGRGLGVGFTLAHQHLGQLPPKIKSAIMANARSRIAFGLSPEDAREMAKTTRGELEHQDFQTLQAFQAYASLLVDGTTAPWLSLTTLPLGTPTGRAADVRARSQFLYGQPLSEVEAELLSMAQHAVPKTDDSIGRIQRRGSND